MVLVFQPNDYKKEDKKIFFLEPVKVTLLFRNILKADSQFNLLPSLDICWRLTFIIRFTWLFFRVGITF